MRDIGLELADGSGDKEALPEEPVNISEKRPKAKMLKTLLLGFKLAWERAGLVILISLAWSITVTATLSTSRFVTHPSLGVILIFVYAAALIGTIPLLAGFLLTHLVASREDISFAILRQKIWEMILPALRLTCVQIMAMQLLFLTFWFYFRLPGLLTKGVCVLTVYLTLFFLMMAIYHWPVLVAQESGVFDAPGKKAKRGVRAVLRRCFFIVMARPLYAVGLLAAISFVSVVLFVTIALPPLLWVGLIAMLLTSAVRALLVQFVVLPLPAQEEIVPDEKFHLK